jgi:hypothetical protein
LGVFLLVVSSILIFVYSVKIDQVLKRKNKIRIALIPITVVVLIAFFTFMITASLTEDGFITYRRIAAAFEWAWMACQIVFLYTIHVDFVDYFNHSSVQVHEIQPVTNE